MQPYPLAHGCDSALNLWCDHNCPHFATHGRLLARYDTSAQGHSNAWRCYAASTLTADGARYARGETYCTRHVQLGEVLARGCAPAITVVYLYENAVDDDGAIAMARALGSGRLPCMKELWLNDNRVTDTAAAAFAAALCTGATPLLVQLKLMTNPQISPTAVDELRAAMKADGAPPGLTINTDHGNVTR